MQQRFAQELMSGFGKLLEDVSALNILILTF